MDLHHFKPNCVFNVDEAEITAVQTKQSKVRTLKEKGKREALPLPKEACYALQ